MFPKSIERLTCILQGSLRLNKARAQCLSAIVLGVIEAKSVLLSAIVTRMPGKAKPTSKYRRLQDYFHEVHLDFGAVATLIMGFIGELTDKPLILALDKTSWKARGNAVDILVLSVCLGDIGLPVFWFDFRRLCSAKTRYRIHIVQRFASLFGAERIHVLVGDKEFIGEGWFKWLISENIPFVMRFRTNMFVTSSRGRKTYARCYFYGLRRGEKRELPHSGYRGIELTMCGLRTRTGEVIILACHGISGDDAIDAYMYRWNIETGFEKLKTHGFDMESSRLHGKGKMDNLLSALAIAMAWAYACGKWSADAQTPIKLKTHGRKEQSIFARGITVLGELLHGLSKELRRTSLCLFTIFREAAYARWKK